MWLHTNMPRGSRICEYACVHACARVCAHVRARVLHMRVISEINHPLEDLS